MLHTKMNLYTNYITKYSFIYILKSLIQFSVGGRGSVPSLQFALRPNYDRSKQFGSVQSLSCVRLFVTPWTAACQASLSIYIITITSQRIAIAGDIPIFWGVWLSSIIILPIGIFLTIKATTDSALLDGESWKKALRKIFKRNN